MRDAQGNEIFVGNLYDFDYEGESRLRPGFSVRMRTAFQRWSSSEVYTEESDWTEWVTFYGTRLRAPVFGEYSQVNCTIKWYVDDSYGVSHFVYTLNGGAEKMVALDESFNLALENGDVVRVKCVPNEEGEMNGYIDSDWVVYTCTDARTPMEAPSNIRVEGSYVCWDAVDGAMRYQVEMIYEGKTQTLYTRSTRYGGKDGAVYRVRALPEDSENYKVSDWSEEIIYYEDNGK